MIDYLPLKNITALHAEEIHEAVAQVIDSGWYLRGEATARFEQEYARYIGTTHCVAVANGLDALTLILRAYIYNKVLAEGDEVIVPANTYIATILSITENRLRPVLVEPRIDTLQIDDALIEQAITPHTKAIMLVHLYGRCSHTPRIADICRRYNLILLEDNAQAHGCSVQSSQFTVHGSLNKADKPTSPALPDYALSPKNYALTRTGSLGHAAAHSFYPGKNLGALGDAGAVTTNDDKLADTIRAIANYGSSRKYVFDYVGVLSLNLHYLDAENERRRQIARFYIDNINNPLIALPPDDDSVFHIFPVLCPQRNKLQDYLAQRGVQTVIHYPIPPHLQDCYPDWHTFCLPITEAIHSQELSIPCHQAMSDAEVEYVSDCINSFY